MKKKLHYETIIDAPRREVWQTMLDRETFGQWTDAFMEGSRYEGSWETGSDIRFLAPDGSGMRSVIAENRPYEFVSIKHIGFIQNGVEDTESEAVRSWAPAFEDYTFSDSGSSTRVGVDMDVTPEYEQHMAEAWPRALESLKQIAEERSR